MAVALPEGKQSFTTATNAPGVGYKLYTYSPGTSTPKATYTTSGGGTPNANPVVMDARGEAAIYWVGSYDVTLKDADDVTIWGPERLETPSVIVDELRADLASTASASDGAGMVGFMQAGAGAAARTVLDKLREWRTPDDFGETDQTGVTSSLSAFQSAIDEHRWVFVTKPGVYKLDGRLLFTVDNTVLWLGPDVTLNCSGWAYPGSQSPFGNQLHITANNCSIIGCGPSSLIQLTGASQANAIGILHKSGLLVKDLAIDGGKATGTANIDDTFESGISIIADSGGGVTTDANATVSCVEIRNFLQYGINVYGNMTGGLRVSGCDIHDNGKTGDALSVGAGIVLTRAVGNVSITGNRIRLNKGKGVFISSAGASAQNFVVCNNNIVGNGLDGIGITEESSFSCISGQGLRGFSISGNNCRSNGRHGILLGTYDSVGFLYEAAITGNTCTQNTNYGILIQSNNSATDCTKDVTVTGNICTANDYGIGLGSNLKNLIVSANIAVGNITENLADSASSAANNVSVGLNQISATSPALQSGVFSPGVVGTTSSGTPTYGSTPSGTYTKLNDRVLFDFVIDVTAHTGTGNMRITGLPFQASGDEPQISLSIQWANLTYTGQAILFVTAAGTTGDLYQVNNGAISAIPMDTVCTLRCSGSYRSSV